MLERTRTRLLAELDPDAVVLDIGGWADPFERADWVIDLMPFDTRGLYARQGWSSRSPQPERFSRRTWIQRDLCDHEPYPFEDNSVDFVICSQTLEDLRDPVWVCHEIDRIGKAGYIEVPSRLEELSWGVEGAWAGWCHHRWLVDIDERGLEFVLKLHSAHARDDYHFPAGFWAQLREDERVQTLWWDHGLECRERVLVDADQSDGYYRDFVKRELARRPPADAAPRDQWRSRLGALKRSASRRALRGLGRLTADEGWHPPEPWRSAVGESLVTPLNLFFLHELCERVGRLGIDGDIVECGVYRGGSAAVLGWSMMRLAGDRKLWLFDSFAGMPSASDRDGEFSHTLAGRYVGSEEMTRQLLRKAGVPANRFRIVRGSYEDTFPRTEVPKTALLHIDCDLYEPVRLVLEKFYPALTPGGFVVINDYGIYKGAHDATDEFLRQQGLEIEPIAIDPTAAYLQKPGAGFSGVPATGHYPGWPGAVA